MPPEGNSNKLSIKSYADDGFSTAKGEFTATINPNNIKISSEVDYHVAQGMGAAGVELKYNISPPRVLSFKLLFDNTGVIPDSEQPIKKQVEALHKVIYDYQEAIHSPYFIRVTWGVIDFKGRLIRYETHYTLFQSDGSPIRAEADIAVIEDKGKEDGGQEGEEGSEGEGEGTTECGEEDGKSLAGVAAGNNLSPKDLAKVNGLHGLRLPKLPHIALPNLLALLAALLAMAEAEAKKGAGWLEKKGEKAKKDGEKEGKKAKDAAKKKADAAKKKAEDTKKEKAAAQKKAAEEKEKAEKKVKDKAKKATSLKNQQKKAEKQVKAKVKKGKEIHKAVQGNKAAKVAKGASKLAKDGLL